MAKFKQQVVVTESVELTRGDWIYALLVGTARTVLFFGAVAVMLSMAFFGWTPLKQKLFNYLLFFVVLGKAYSPLIFKKNS
jgi:hypothetical protein